MMMTPVGVVFPVFRRRSRLVAPPAWTYIALSDEGKAMTDTAIDTAARPEELGTLPEWDLRDLYSDPDSPELQADLERAAADASAFASAHKGRLAGYDGDALAAAIAAYEALDERLSRIVSYASLVHAGDISNPEIGRFYQTIQERVNAISTELLFFTLEINRIPDDALDAKLGDPALARSAPWLRDARAFRPPQLSHDLAASEERRVGKELGRPCRFCVL